MNDRLLKAVQTVATFVQETLPTSSALFIEEGYEEELGVFTAAVTHLLGTFGPQIGLGPFVLALVRDTAGSDLSHAIAGELAPWIEALTGEQTEPIGGGTAFDADEALARLERSDVVSSLGAILEARFFAGYDHDDEYNHLQVAAVHILGSLSPHVAIPVLVDKLYVDGRDGLMYDVGDAIVDELTRLGDRRAVPLLLARLPHVTVDEEAFDIVRVLGRLPTILSVEPLIDVLDHAGDGHLEYAGGDDLAGKTLWNAAMALGDIGDPRAIPALERALNNQQERGAHGDYFWPFHSAARALATMAAWSPEAKSVLISFTQTVVTWAKDLVDIDVHSLRAYGLWLDTIDDSEISRATYERHRRDVWVEEAVRFMVKTLASNGFQKLDEEAEALNGNEALSPDEKRRILEHVQSVLAEAPR